MSPRTYLLQSGYSSSNLCSLSLSIIKISRNSNYGICYFFSEVFFCIYLQLFQNKRRKLLWGVIVSVYFQSEVAAHLSFYRKTGSFRINGSLSFRKITYLICSVRHKRNNRWCCSISFFIGDNFRRISVQYRYTTVCCS